MGVVTPIGEKHWIQPDFSFEALMRQERQAKGASRKDVLQHVRLGSALGRVKHLGRAYLRWSKRMIHTGYLSPTQKRMIAMRAAWRHGCAYEWAHHARLAKQAGLTAADLALIAQETSTRWTAEQAVLMRAVDDLLSNGALTDGAWASLGRHFDDVQRMEFCMVVGHSRMLSIVLNSLAIKLDPPLRADELPAPGRLGPSDNGWHGIATAHLPGYPLGVWRVEGEPRVEQLQSKDGDLVQRFFLFTSRRVAKSSTNINIIAMLIRMRKIFPYHLWMLLHLLERGQLPRAEKEQAIMRVGWRAGDRYEWAHHAHMGKAAGLSPGEIARVAQEDCATWNPRQRAMFAGVDTILRDGHLPREQGETMLALMSEAEFVEFIFVVAHYAMISLTNNSLRVTVEPAFEPGAAH